MNINPATALFYLLSLAQVLALSITSYMWWMDGVELVVLETVRCLTHEPRSGPALLSLIQVGKGLNDET